MRNNLGNKVFFTPNKKYVQRAASIESDLISCWSKFSLFRFKKKWCSKIYAKSCFALKSTTSNHSDWVNDKYLVLELSVHVI